MEGGGDTKGMMYAERQSKMAILTAAAADAANSLMTSLLAHNVWWVTWFVCLDFLFHWVCVRVCVCVYTRFYIHILFAKSAVCPCFYYMPAIATQLLPLLLPLLLTVGLVCSSSSPLSLPFLHLHAAARLSLTRIFCVPQTVVVAFVKFSSAFSQCDYWSRFSWRCRRTQLFCCGFLQLQGDKPKWGKPPSSSSGTTTLPQLPFQFCCCCWGWQKFRLYSLYITFLQPLENY